MKAFWHQFEFACVSMLVFQILCVLSYLCVCVFLYVFVGIWLSLCIYYCLCVHSFLCACVCICVDVFMRVHLRWYMFLLGVNTCMCLFLSVFVCTFYVSLGSFVLARQHVCTRMCLSVCACGSACVCACVIFQSEYSRTIINILPSYVPSSTKVEKKISPRLCFSQYSKRIIRDSILTAL